MSALAMRMPPDVASTVTLATQVVSTDAPVWAVAHDAVNPHHNGHFELKGRRSPHDIFRLPNMGGVVRDWVYTRPTMEAVGEDAFANAAAESSTIFRIEAVDPTDSSITITPTVSNHWLLVPCQTVNGFTVGLTYLDVLYQRDAWGTRDNRVPPLKLGRFVIEDATGEVFVTGWTGNIMIVGWIQSIIKCERVRELLLFEAPPANCMPPRNLLLRNSFYERRKCSICGKGPQITQLPPPCSGINKRLAHDPSKPPPLTNVSTLYRRFRGGYFGVCLKTKYAKNRMLEPQQLVPVFIDVKHGLNSVKTSFKINLRKNVDIVLDAASNDGYFGMNPRASTRVLLLRASDPVDSLPVIEEIDDEAESRSESTSVRKSVIDRSTTASPISAMKRTCSAASLDTSPGQDGCPVRRRVRVEDSLKRDSVLHQRKVRNRESAAKSNRIRKMQLEQKKKDLAKLKDRVPQLRERLQELSEENKSLRIRVFGMELGDGLRVPVPVEKKQDDIELEDIHAQSMGEEDSVHTIEDGDVDLAPVAAVV